MQTQAQAQAQVTVTDNLKAQLNQLVTTACFYKETPSTFSYSFVIKNCQHGGTSAADTGFPTYEIAVWEALAKAVEITAQGFHYHGGSKKYKN